MRKKLQVLVKHRLWKHPLPVCPLSPAHEFCDTKHTPQRRPHLRHLLNAVVLWSILMFGHGGCMFLGGLEPVQSEYRAEYSVGIKELWPLVLHALKDFPIYRADRDRGYLETGWVEGFADKPSGLFKSGLMGEQWRRRIRFFIQIQTLSEEKTGIRLVSRVEEKPSGEAQAFYWQRVRSNGKREQKIFEHIQELVGSSPSALQHQE